MLLAAALAAAPAAACELPADEEGVPWRRVVARVRLLPEVDAFAGQMGRDKVVVQYVARLDEPQRLEGRCFWPVEVRAGGRLWRRFLVTPDGERVRLPPPG